MLPAGAKVTIGGTTGGTYGYLHVGGGIASDTHCWGPVPGHLSAGLGQPLGRGRRALRWRRQFARDGACKLRVTAALTGASVTRRGQHADRFTFTPEEPSI